MDNSDELYKNLIVLLKMFKNRPYHLAKYLVDNEAFNESFVQKIVKSNKLNEISDDSGENSVTPVYFVDISKMVDFYNSFAEDGTKISKGKNIEELTIELNKKLDECIQNDNFEEASKIRDYMTRNCINRINKF